MNLLKYTLLVLLSVFGLCSCGGNAAGNCGRSAPLINVTVNKGGNVGGYRAGFVPPRPRLVNCAPRPARPVVIIGATTPYLRVGCRNPDPRCFSPAPRHAPCYSNGGGYGGYPGVNNRGYDPYDPRVDPRVYGPRERFNPYKYGSMPDGRAQNFPGDATYGGFIRNHPELIGGRRY